MGANILTMQLYSKWRMYIWLQPYAWVYGHVAWTNYSDCAVSIHDKACRAGIYGRQFYVEIWRAGT